jgi:Protein of unknown function (DUF2846)
MATNPTILSQRFWRTGASVLLLAMASCAATPPPTASVAVPPVPAGEARVWFYRDSGPYETQQRPYIRMNEQIAGISEPRGAFYRDVPPGHYHITVDQYASGLTDLYLTRDIDLAAGQQVYIKIVSLENFLGGGGAGGEAGGGNGYERPIFYVWTIPPETASAEVARTPFTAGS